MLRLLLRAGVLTLSLGMLALLMVHAAAPAGCARDTTVTRTAPGAAIAVDAGVTAQLPAKKKQSKEGLYGLRMPATKADPHVAKMLAEEAAKQAGALRRAEPDAADLPDASSELPGAR